MFNIMKRIFMFLLYVVCILAVMLGVYSGIQRLNGNQQPMIFGWGAAVVQTGSMEPNVPVGTLIIIQEQDTYLPGDVVTYIDYRGWSITHRVLSINNGKVVTQGDANSAADPIFDETAIIGKMQYMIPGVGPVLDFITQPVVICSLFLLLIVSVIWDGIVTSKKKKKLRQMFKVTVKSTTPNMHKMFSVKR